MNKTTVALTAISLAVVLAGCSAQSSDTSVEPRNAASSQSATQAKGQEIQEWIDGCRDSVNELGDLTEASVDALLSNDHQACASAVDGMASLLDSIKEEDVPQEASVAKAALVNLVTTAKVAAASYSVATTMPDGLERNSYINEGNDYMSQVPSASEILNEELAKIPQTYRDQYQTES